MLHSWNLLFIFWFTLKYDDVMWLYCCWCSFWVTARTQMNSVWLQTGRTDVETRGFSLQLHGRTASSHVWIPSLSELLWLLLRLPTEDWVLSWTRKVRSTKFVPVASEMLHRRHLRWRWWLPATRLTDGVLNVYFFLFCDKGEYWDNRRAKVLRRSKGALGQMPLRCCGCDFKQHLHNRREL